LNLAWKAKEKVANQESEKEIYDQMRLIRNANSSLLSQGFSAQFSLHIDFAKDDRKSAESL